MNKTYYNYKKKNNKFNINYLIFVLILILSFLLLSIIIKTIDNAIVPIALSESNMITKTKVNEAIYISVSEIIKKDNLTSDKFYILNKSEDEKIQSIYIDTILINNLCNDIAVNLSSMLNDTKIQKISIPIGIITGFKIFSNIGPNYNVLIKPMGNAIVDYESKFINVGINQINFELWLKIDTEIKLINPPTDEKIIITRKVPLVNTIINSDMPMNYFYKDIQQN